MIGHKITTERRSDDWIAFFTEQPEVWDVGATQAEALGKLYISYHYYEETGRRLDSIYHRTTRDVGIRLYTGGSH